METTTQASVLNDVEMSGLTKASVLLISLGAGVSAGIMQQLTPDEIERLTSEIVRHRRVPTELRKQVFDECKTLLADEAGSGGADYACEVLQQVFGEVKAREIVQRVSRGTAAGMSPGRVLRSIPARQLGQALTNERPQVVALVIAHLPADQAAQTLAALPEDLQGECALRLTTMQPTDPEIIRHIAEVLLQQISGPDSAAFSEVGGNETVVKILDNAGRSMEKRILEYITNVDEDIANAIKEKMFTFDVVTSLDDRSLQTILRDVPQDDLRLALKGSPGPVKDVFFRNMSQRAAETLQEDLEASGPVKLRDVEAAQSRIVNIARQLDEAGEISLRSSGEDMVV
jgi:flagellar motor switch protein FliG